MGNTWKATLQAAGDGSVDRILELPDEVMAELGWGIGDKLELIPGKGEILLRKACPAEESDYSRSLDATYALLLQLREVTAERDVNKPGLWATILGTGHSAAVGLAARSRNAAIPKSNGFLGEGMSYDPHDDDIGDFVERVMKDRSIEGSRYYLGCHGDAVEERINSTLSQSRDLLKHGFPAAALVLASTAIEILIRFMLVRPLVQGAFLSDEWADLLASRIGTGRTDEDRKILPSLLKQWGLDINGIILPGNKRLWDTITNVVLPKRNRVVHIGITASPEESALALACADSLIADILHPLAKSLGFTLEDTGKWCQIRRKIADQSGTSGEWWSSFTPRSPFEDA